MFMYIQPLPEGMYLPRTNHCGGIHCKFFNYRPPKRESNLLCTYCWKTDHTRSRLSTETCCNVCKLPDHSPSDKSCPHFQTRRNLTPFCGADDVLSNFYPCELEIFGIEYKSAEHAFQYTCIKAVRCGDRFCELLQGCWWCQLGPQSRSLTHFLKTLLFTFEQWVVELWS